WAAQCPAHEDRQNSLSVGEGADGRALLKCFAGCRVESIVEEVGLQMSDLFSPSSTIRPKVSTSPKRCHADRPPKNSHGGGAHIPPHDGATLQPSTGCTLSQYAAAKRLPMDFLLQLGLMDIHLGGVPAVRIPYRGTDDAEIAVRLRTNLRKAEEGDHRFRW